MGAENRTDIVSSALSERRVDQRWPVELLWFRNLRPRIHPWIEITPDLEGGAEFYDFIMATRLHLNQTAYLIVKRMYAGEQTLGEIATAIARQFDQDEYKLLTAVVRIYKQLEANDATVHPLWRYLVLYCQYLHEYLIKYKDVFFQAFWRGLGG
jgi:hypothetical protein